MEAAQSITRIKPYSSYESLDVLAQQLELLFQDPRQAEHRANALGRYAAPLALYGTLSDIIRRQLVIEMAENGGHFAIVYADRPEVISGIFHIGFKHIHLGYPGLMEPADRNSYDQEPFAFPHSRDTFGYLQGFSLALPELDPTGVMLAAPLPWAVQGYRSDYFDHQYVAALAATNATEATTRALTSARLFAERESNFYATSAVGAPPTTASGRIPVVSYGLRVAFEGALTGQMPAMGGATVPLEPVSTSRDEPLYLYSNRPPEELLA